MSTYYVTVGRFGHTCLSRRISRHGSERIHGPKPWGGGKVVQSFRSRSDSAAVARFEAERRP